MISKTEGIILKTYDLRETSKIVVFYSKEYGKLKGVMKGVRTNPSKFGSSVDRFSVNDFVFYRYSRSELHLISECDLREFYFNLRQDYQRNVAASYILELVDCVMPLENANTTIYQLILDYLQALQTTKDIDKLVFTFQIKILILSGFRPHIDSCVLCQKVILGKARFSMKMGGLICTACPTTERSFHLVSQGVVSSILYIEKHRWQECMKLGLTSAVKKELKFILNNFLVFHLEKKLKSVQFM